MTLNLSLKGKKYIVKNIELKREINSRLEAIGMTKNSEITVFSNNNRGTVIIKIRGSRYAIGRGISKNITIVEKDEREIL
jgi:ferrous iron transport protein A